MIALFDAEDRAHAHYTQLLTAGFDSWQLHTTWPCVTEASHLLSGIARLEMLRWVGLGGVSLYPLDPQSLLDMTPWMQAYSEPPRSVMDLADASLYWLALDTDLTRIWTVDHRDFLRYRLPDGRAFELV
jgi:predicted nucleic acid-binding protein